MGLPNLGLLLSMPTMVELWKKSALNLSNLWPVNAVLLSRPDCEQGENGLNSTKFGLFTLFVFPLFNHMDQNCVARLHFCVYETETTILGKIESNQITFDRQEGIKLSFATYLAFSSPSRMYL